MLVPVNSPVLVNTDLSYIEQHNASPSTSSHTFTSVDFGAAHRHRYVVIALHYLNSGAFSPDPTSVTIGGVTASRIIAGANVGLYSGLFIAPLPTGTSGSVAIATVTTLNSVGIGVFRLIHHNGTEYDTDSSTSDGSLSIDTKAGGVLIACSSNNNNGATSWTNATEQYDVDFRSDDWISGAIVTTTSAETLAVTSSTGLRSCCASWS